MEPSWPHGIPDNEFLHLLWCVCPTVNGDINGEHLRKLQIWSCPFSPYTAAKGWKLAEISAINRPFTVAILEACIARFASSYRIPKEFNITRDQMTEAANDTLKTHSSLTIQEVYLALEKARQGVLGKVYNRIDSPVILDLLNQYKMSDWKRNADRRIDSENHKAEREKLTPANPEYAGEVIKSLIEKFSVQRTSSINLTERTTAITQEQWEKNLSDWATNDATFDEIDALIEQYDFQGHSEYAKTLRRIKIERSQ